MKLTLKTVTSLAKLAANVEDNQLRIILEEAAQAALKRSIVITREFANVNQERHVINYINSHYGWKEKIPAIKYAKNELSMGLKQAKDFVEQQTHFRDRPSDYYTR